jgi:hypothetical protein
MRVHGGAVDDWDLSQTAVEAVMMMASLAGVGRAAVVVKLSANRFGMAPATKVSGTADVHATDVALVVPSIAINIKARTIIVALVRVVERG